MVRPVNVGRSRGCRECKKRRIKCDLKTPSCQRCTESNRICSGPETGLFIVNSSKDSYVSTTSKKPQKLQDQPQTAKHLNQVVLKKDGTSCHAYQPYKGDAKIYSIPDSSSLYDEALLWKFMNFFSENTGRSTWFSRLPDLVRRDKALALQTAARAVSLAYASQATNNSSAKALAYEYYGRSLKHHRKSLATMNQNTNLTSRRSATHALPVTVLLSYFEMITATSSDAWLRHTLAAEKLLAFLGPEAMEDEFLNHLYFMVRSHSAIRSFLLGTPSTFSAQPWLVVPNISPCGNTWHVHNRVMDLIVWISDAANGISTMQQHDQVTPSRFTQASLEVTLLELERLWEYFCEICCLDAQEYPLFGISDPADLSTTTTIPTVMAQPRGSLPASYIHAAVIMVISLSEHSRYSSPSLSCSSYAESPTKTTTVSEVKLDISYHSQQILSLSALLRSHHIGCACARMLLPLSVVHRLDPSMSRRRIAQEFFTDWCREDGLEGLIGVAFPDKEVNELRDDLRWDSGVFANGVL